MSIIHIIMIDGSVLSAELIMMSNGILEVKDLKMLPLDINDEMNNQLKHLIRLNGRYYEKSLINVDNISSIHFIDEKKWNEYNKKPEVVQLKVDTNLLEDK